MGHTSHTTKLNVVKSSVALIWTNHKIKILPGTDFDAGGVVMDSARLAKSGAVEAGHETEE